MTTTCGKTWHFAVKKMETFEKNDWLCGVSVLVYDRVKLEWEWKWVNEFFWNSFLLTCVTSWEPFDPIAGHAFNIVRLSPTDRGREPWTRNRKECFPIEPRTNAWYPLSIINIWDTMGPIFFNLPPKGPAVIFQDGFWLNMSIPLQIKNTSLQKWHNLKKKNKL